VSSFSQGLYSASSDQYSVEPNSAEFTELQNYLVKTQGATHGMKYKVCNKDLETTRTDSVSSQVEEIFRIERNGEDDRFSKSPYAKLKGDRRLLWHGSRTTNFGGILSQGLRIAPPEAPVNGYMFGKGVYLADISSKSANYCQHHQSGGIGLLLLCEAELGKPMLELLHSDQNAAENAKKEGCYATWGQGVTGPVAWKNAGCVSKALKGVMMVSSVKLISSDVVTDWVLSLILNALLRIPASMELR
jgi:poly [ADP-ribose] polymerase